MERPPGAAREQSKIGKCSGLKQGKVLVSGERMVMRHGEHRDREADEHDRGGGPRVAPEDLDRFLPYAIALEVKEAWGDHLSQTFFASTVCAEE